MTPIERRNQANELYDAGELSAALEIFRSLLDEEYYNSVAQRKAGLINAIGLTYHSMANYPDALEAFMKASEIIEEVGHDQMMGAITNNIGMIYITHGDYPKALEYYRKALPFQIEAGDRESHASTLMNIGDLLRMLGDIDGALSYMHDAVNEFTEIDNAHNVAKASMFIAFYLHQQGDDDEAEKWINKAMAIVNQITNLHDRVFAIRVVCVIRTDQDRFDEVFALMEQYKDEIEHFPNESTNIQALKALILVKQGEHERAREVFEYELERAIELRSMYPMIEGHKKLRDLAKTMGDFDAYVKHNEEYQRLTSEFRGMETARKVAIQEAERNMAKERTERDRERAILYGALPKEIADRMVRGEEVSDHIDAASVIFVDLVGFTTITSTLTSQQVSILLDTVFALLDEACARNDVMKVKTIGDSYMAFCYVAQ